MGYNEKVSFSTEKRDAIKIYIRKNMYLILSSKNCLKLCSRQFNGERGI